MKNALVLAGLMSVGAQAAPQPAFSIRSADFAGFAPVRMGELIIPVPVGVPMRLKSNEAQTVDLLDIRDRHFYTTDSFQGAGGVTFVAGTLDAAKDGYLVVSLPGETPRLIKIERTMSGSWTSGGHVYNVRLSVDIFRPRLDNVIEIRNATTGRLVWAKRINDLFRLTYAAGKPVTLGGRPYRLFYSTRPSMGLCFIYDDARGNVHDYKFYLIPLSQIQGPAPVSYPMFGGDVVKLHVSADNSSLMITR